MLAGLDDWRESVRRDYAGLARVPAHDLSWVTVIADARVIQVTDRGEWVPGLISDFRAGMRGHLMKTGSLAATRWRGVIEYDLLAPRLYRLGPVKSAMLGAFGIDPATVDATARIIVPHAHMVVDCRGHGGRDGLAESLHRLYRLPRQVMVKPLMDGPVADNLERLASYSVKMRFEYSLAWDDRQTKYYGPYEPKWIGTMERIIGYVGLDGLSFRSVK